MKEYVVTKSACPDWSRVPELAISENLWLKPRPIRAYGQLCYDQAALHVRLRAFEEEITATRTGLFERVWNDSCLELFFSPVWGDLHYFNLECNPKGAMCIGYGHNLGSLVRLVPSDPGMKQLIVPEVFFFPGGWGVCYDVPFAFIRELAPAFAPGSSVKFRANCYKCGDETPHPHFMSWNPVRSETPDFHRPEDFGVMIFE